MITEYRRRTHGTNQCPADPLAGEPHGLIHGRRTLVQGVRDDLQESIALVDLNPGHEAERDAETDARAGVVKAKAQPF
ncbi:hypothetical protein [Streptomyces sp. NPDC047985]|uniref:hypothetical protein n=1 Tax=unclassified Streptomyces TaxID=2593676 RepID=UPI00341309E4